MADSLDDLIHRADLDDLVRHVESTSAARDWVHLVRVRDRARAAVDTGRQLWPIATLANYRLALHAPAEFAVRALDDSARTFMPGPISEILAIHHSWTELEPHLAPDHDRSLVAYERAFRGDVIEIDEPAALEIPFSLAPWEPKYQLADYDDDGLIDEMPDLAMAWHPCTPRASDQLNHDCVRVFREMMSHWTSNSNGIAKAVMVDGEIEEAFSALEIATPDFSQVSLRETVSWLTWAASSGGAYGRRRGAASGRSHALWLLSVFTGTDEDWPDTLDHLGAKLADFEYFAFRSPSHWNEDWWLQLVIVDPDRGISLGLLARDSMEPR